MARKPKSLPKPPDQERAQTVLRTVAPLIESLRHFAAWHDRTMNDEIEIACQVHVTRSMVDLLSNSPVFRAELETGRPELDVDAFLREQEAHLADLKRHAVRVPPSMNRIVELME